MENLKWFGKLCLALAVALEFGSILGNVTEGYSPFYLFDLSQRFSMNNNTFIIYWGSVVGIFFVLADALTKFENENNNAQSTRNSTPQSSISVIDKLKSQDRSKEEIDKVLSEGLGAYLSGMGVLAAIFLGGPIVYGIFKEEGYVMGFISIIVVIMILGLWALILEFLAKKRFLN